MKKGEYHPGRTMRIGIVPSDGSGTVAVSERQLKAEGRTWRTQHLQRDTHFYKLLESVYDAVLITDQEGKVLECNARAVDFFIRPLSSLVGVGMITLISGATEALIETIKSNLKDRKFTLVEARCKRSDGSSFAAEIAVNKLNLDNSEQLCFFVRDITIRQEAQNALQNAIERLEAHDRARMEFVSNVSHELRTPLTSMIYAISNMLRGVVGPMSEKATHYLERLQSDSQRLLATVNDILDLRQIENHNLVLTKKVVPLGAVIRNGVDTLQIQADAKRIGMLFDFMERELFCLCDSQKIERVVLNIVGNAIKFTPAQGQITMRLEQHPERAKMALLTVSDTGMGIPQEMLPRLSQRYFRVGDHVSGTGLGLAITREMVELHGGTVEFASPVPGSDCGTAVYISLPLATKMGVLAYSSDPETVKLLRERIVAHGYALHMAESAFEAEQECCERPPALLILDSRAEDLNVRDMILQLRERAATKRLPVIVLGEMQLERSDLELYRHFDVFYVMLPWRKSGIARTLAMAVLGKLR